MATTITSAGSKPAMAISQSGAEHHFWRTDAGAIQTLMQSRFGTALITATTVVLSGVQDDSIAAWTDRFGKIYLAYRNDAGEIVTVSSDDGTSFS